MTEQFTILAAQETVYQSPVNAEFQAQRDRLSKFFEYFQGKLRSIISEADGEIRILKERKFDDKMMKLLIKYHQDLISIFMQIDKESPYTAAEKFVKLILEGQSGHIVNNLEFLSKHHLQQTNVDFMSGKILQHPQIISFDKVKELAANLKKFMIQHPIIKPAVVPTQPISLQENLQDVPAFFSKQNDKTKA